MHATPLKCMLLNILHEHFTFKVYHESSIAYKVGNPLTGMLKSEKINKSQVSSGFLSNLWPTSHLALLGPLALTSNYK